MRFATPLTRGEFRNRVNRFKAIISVKGREIPAHVPNSGRLRELFVEGASALLASCGASHRLTSYDLVLIQHSRRWVSIDSRLTNALVFEAWQSGTIREFQKYGKCKKEVTYGNSRFDFLFSGRKSQCLVEVKSSTLIVGRTAKFPDAPTTRGVKHLKDLIKAREAGYRAVMLFCIQRSDAAEFRPNDENDPDFGETLRIAHRAGVQVLAYKCAVTSREVRMTGSVPVILKRM